MKQTTRFQFNAFLSRIAELNSVDTGDLDKKFSVEPSVTQTLMTRVQESSAFLQMINIIPVDEMKGEKVGVGVSGSIASTADTSGTGERQTADFNTLTAEGYECRQTNYDFHFRYATLDLWARYQDFQARLRDAIVKRQALDRITIGFNGVVWTNGIGHTAGVKPQTQISERQAAVNLVEDVMRVEKGIARCMPVAMPQPVYDAVVSFAFNVGVTAACQSTLAFFISKGKWRDACEQLPRWVFVNGVRVTGLERRRANERAYCLRGV